MCLWYVKKCFSLVGGVCDRAVVGVFMVVRVVVGGMPLSDEKKEELKEEMPKVAVAGSSVRTKPGTDPEEAFDDGGDSDTTDESSDSRVVRFVRWLLG